MAYYISPFILRFFRKESTDVSQWIRHTVYSYIAHREMQGFDKENEETQCINRIPATG